MKLQYFLNWHRLGPLCLRPYKKGLWALYVYSIANFVALWLKWLQMSLYVSKTSTEIIWIHLKSFKSWGDKNSYTINMQRSLPFFVGSQTQCSDEWKW